MWTASRIVRGAPVLMTALAGAIAAVAGCHTTSVSPVEDVKFQVTPVKTWHPSSAEAAARRDKPLFQHVLIVILENQDQEKAIADPYLKGLAQAGANFTDLHGLVHPSYANYLAMISGHLYTTQGDTQINVGEESIADSLTEKSLTWKNYAEGYPGNCFLGDTAKPKYARKHVPFLSFTRVQNGQCGNVVPADAFTRDVAHLSDVPLPNYAFYTPDLDNDGHDSGLTGGTKFLKAFLEPLRNNTAFMKEMLIVVTYDESGGGQPDTNHIYTVFLGDMVKPGDYDRTYNHFNVLRTIEDNFGLPPLAEGDRDAAAITDVWR